jgi:hypothetical protein
MKMGLELFLEYLEHFDNRQELVLVSFKNNLGQLGQGLLVKIPTKNNNFEIQILK